MAGRHCGIDLRLEVGEHVAVLGRNGAGETTLLLHPSGVLGGDVRAGSRRVVVGGVGGGRWTWAVVRRRVGVVIQDPDDQQFMLTFARAVAVGPPHLGRRQDERRRLCGRRWTPSTGPGTPGGHTTTGAAANPGVWGSATAPAMLADVLVPDEPSANLEPGSEGVRRTVCRFASPP